MRILSRTIAILVLSTIITGCGTLGIGKDKEEEQDAAVEDRSGAGGPGAAESRAAQGAGKFTGDPLDDPNSLLAKRVVYFDFDDSRVMQDFRDIIQAHAAYLSANPGISVILEGHADERGTREYNIALGEKRAKAVRQLLILQGAAARQVESVSYGEEKPASLGHDEASWRLNRRVELIYQR